jgi:hypothetical protein
LNHGKVLEADLSLVNRTINLVGNYLDSLKVGHFEHQASPYHAFVFMMTHSVEAATARMFILAKAPEQDN